MSSNDPEFEAKAGDVIGLYLKPPQHAAVFCVDEKTAIQPLDRNGPPLPLFAALDTRTGKVIGRTAPAAHQRGVRRLPLADRGPRAGWARDPRHRRQPVHHKTRAVREFFDLHPNVRIHHTPIYSLWLNQIELWFSKLKRDLLARVVFPSIKDLDRKIMRYIREHSRDPKPFKWSYRDPSHRIIPRVSTVTVR